MPLTGWCSGNQVKRRGYDVALAMGNKSMTRNSRLAFALLVLFVLSGFAGLIYQSVWSHYLGLTLGHAAYAQTLVLAIYMGGMALGAWLASRYSLHWKRLVLGYAIVEGIIGIGGLVFHQVFVRYTGLSQDVVLPALQSPVLAHAYQWLTAALLIAPQSILLGATFPLMSAGLIRALPQEQGEVLGGLYFSNSLGAALGALVATFVLLPAVGLPGTVLTAGLLNILVAIGAWALSKRLVETDYAPASASTAETPVGSPTAEAAVPEETRHLGRILLLATAISGAASFVYELGWVRMLNQALGATVHSFELMLAAFILGLAFGGLWIRNRAHSIAEPVRYVGYVQVLMGIAALFSILVFTQSFTWVGWMMAALSRGENSYVLFELGTALIALLVMFPAAFFAGMTLPLFTVALLRKGAGERVIGRIYAANTLGAIVGVVLMMHVLVPLLGIRLSVTLAAVADVVLGLYLLRVINPARLSRPVAITATASVVAIALSLVLGKPDPFEQAAGVFRTGRVRLDPSAQMNYLRDGKTATVAVSTIGQQTAISTNGKPDASLTPMDAQPTQDEITMIMAGVLPLALHPAPKQVAIIGWGSGLTTHTLLGSPVPASVDTVEIERAMYDGAKVFGPRVARAYSDPRSHVRIDDARTFFSMGARRYDVIISEPSNPWVSGVAGLFTHEFYAFLKRHLNQGGMLVQWLHTYELDDPLVATMLGALASEFQNTGLYLTNSADLLIVARTDPGMRPLSQVAKEGTPLHREMLRVGAESPEELQLRYIGGSNVLNAFLRMTSAVPHSDFYPTVSLRAPRTRFMAINSEFLQNLVVNGLPVLDILDCRRPLGSEVDLPVVNQSTFSRWRGVALAMAHAATTGAVHGDLVEASPSGVAAFQALMASTRQIVQDPEAINLWSGQVSGLARGTLGLLPEKDLQNVWITPAWLTADAMTIPAVRTIMSAYSATARRSPAEMRLHAEQVLALPEASLSPLLREQMLVIAMLGAIGTDDRAAVFALDRRWGAGVNHGRELTPVRSYLMAWADGDTPACVARR